MKQKPMLHPLKYILVREMFHNILNPTVQNVAKLIDGIHFNILIVLQSIDLRPIYVVVGIQIILCNSALLHGDP